LSKLISKEKFLRWLDDYEVYAKDEEKLVIEYIREVINKGRFDAAGWISVKDRLPDDDTQVLAVDRYGDQEVVLFVDGYFQPDYIGEVTHWMPLPKPPKGEDNE
jgi:hypothetical protein